MEDMAHQATQDPKRPTELSPKEWQKHHDNWLNAVMQNSIRETKPLDIPDFHAHIPVLRPGPDLLVAPYGFWTPLKNPESRILSEFHWNMFEPEHQIVPFTTGTGIRIRNWTGTVTV